MISTWDGFGPDNLTVTGWNPQMQWVKVRCPDGSEREFHVLALREDDEGELEAALDAAPLYHI